MVGILVISHGRLAEALVSSARFIIGNIRKIGTVSIWPRDNEMRIRKRIEKGLCRVDQGDGVLVLTDLWGGTPTNVSLSLLGTHRLEIVTGVNMPMLLTLSSYRNGRSLEQISRLVKKSGRRSIIIAKGLLDWRNRANSSSPQVASVVALGK
jgi:mannose PTS system EIIA component